MIIGYQFINKYGYPAGNAQPTLEDVENMADGEPEGCFYTINKSEDGTTFMCLIGRKHCFNILKG